MLQSRESGVIAAIVSRIYGVAIQVIGENVR